MECKCQRRGQVAAATMPSPFVYGNPSYPPRSPLLVGIKLLKQLGPSRGNRQTAPSLGWGDERVGNLPRQTTEALEWSEDCRLSVRTGGCWLRNARVRHSSPLWCGLEPSVGRRHTWSRWGLVESVLTSMGRMRRMRREQFSANMLSWGWWPHRIGAAARGGDNNGNPWEAKPPCLCLTGLLPVELSFGRTQ